MTTYKHIVQVHPVENGEPNLYKVKEDHEFDTQYEAEKFVGVFNSMYGKFSYEAVYLGRVNDETGELE